MCCQKSFAKVRYFSFFAPGYRKRLLALRLLLEHNYPEYSGQPEIAPADAAPVPKLCCPGCGQPCFFSAPFSRWDAARHAAWPFRPCFSTGCWISRLHPCSRSPQARKYSSECLLHRITCLCWLVFSMYNQYRPTHLMADMLAALYYT